MRGEDDLTALLLRKLDKGLDDPLLEVGVLGGFRLLHRIKDAPVARCFPLPLRLCPETAEKNKSPHPTFPLVDGDTIVAEQPQLEGGLELRVVESRLERAG